MAKLTNKFPRPRSPDDYLGGATTNQMKTKAPGNTGNKGEHTDFSALFQEVQAGRESIDALLEDPTFRKGLLASITAGTPKLDMEKLVQDVLRSVSERSNAHIEADDSNQEKVIIEFELNAGTKYSGKGSRKQSGAITKTEPTDRIKKIVNIFQATLIHGVSETGFAHIEVDCSIVSLAKGIVRVVLSAGTKHAVTIARNQIGAITKIEPTDGIQEIVNLFQAALIRGVSETGFAHIEVDCSIVNKEKGIVRVVLTAGAKHAVTVSRNQIRASTKSELSDLSSLPRFQSDYPRKLESEFDELLANMQTTKSKRAVQIAFAASSAHLGRAAVKQAGKKR